jgi:hypothetical protein
MTESAFPFPAQGDAAGSAAAPVEEAVSAESNRRKLLLGGAAVLLALVAAGYFLFLRGGSSDANTAFVPQHHAATAAAAKAKAKAPVKQSVPQTFNGSVGRDPFKPLVTVVPPPATAATTATTSTTPSSTSTPPASTPVSLQKVYSQNGKAFAQTMINGTVYKPTVGQTFAGTFQLLSVSGKTATFVQGDEQFSLSVGQVVVR